MRGDVARGYQREQLVAVAGASGITNVQMKAKRGDAESGRGGIVNFHELAGIPAGADDANFTDQQTGARDKFDGAGRVGPGVIGYAHVPTGGAVGANTGGKRGGDLCVTINRASRRLRRRWIVQSHAAGTAHAGKNGTGYSQSGRTGVVWRQAVVRRSRNYGDVRHRRRTDHDDTGHARPAMDRTKVGEGASLTKSVRVHRATARGGIRSAIYIARRTEGAVAGAGTATSDVVTACAPSPSNRVAHGDVNRAGRKLERAARRHSDIEYLTRRAGTSIRYDAPVLIDNGKRIGASVFMQVFRRECDRRGADQQGNCAC